MKRLVVAVFCAGVILSSCGLFDSEDIETVSVRVSPDGHQLDVTFTPCMRQGTAKAEVAEHDGRVVVDLYGEATNDDCWSSAEVTLTSELGGRVVVVGPASEEFEHCGQEFLCRT